MSFFTIWILLGILGQVITSIRLYMSYPNLFKYKFRMKLFSTYFKLLFTIFVLGGISFIATLLLFVFDWNGDVVLKKADNVAYQRLYQ